MVEDSGVVPGHTLYVKNLDEKVHPDRTKMVLYTAFSRFGSVLEVHCARKKSVKGQAWVVFKEVAQAIEAKKHMETKELFKKPLEIHFAKQKSDIIARKDGTFKPRPKRRAEDRPAGEQPNGNKKAKTQGDESAAASNGSKAADNKSSSDENPPHSILLATELPSSIATITLNKIFGSCTGFDGCRLVPAKNLAFIDFDSEPNATKAKNALQGHVLEDGYALKLSYAKK